MLLFMMVGITTLGGFILGFDSGVIVDGKDQISLALGLSDLDWSICASISIVGAMLSLPIIGKLADKFSSKNMLIYGALIYLLGLTITSFANNSPQFIMGRFIIGVSLGTLAFNAPLYISEIAPANIRGMMILLNNTAITAGQALSFLAAYLLHDINQNSWKFLLYIQIIPSLILFIGMFLMPASTHIKTKNSQAKRSHNSLSKLILSRKFAPIFSIGLALAILQQFAGISAIMNYGQVIFQLAGTHSIKDAFFSIFIIGTINFIFTLISALLVDWFGRRLLLLSGTILAGSCMIGLSMSLGNEKSSLIYMVGFIIGYCISLGSVFWVLISEIYPSHVRGIMMSIITAIQYAASFIVSISFLQMINYLGSKGVFELFAMMCFIAFLFIYFYIPETKGILLEHIEENLNMGKPVRYIGRQATL